MLVSPSMEEETKDQRHEVTCPQLHSWQAAEQDLNPGCPAPESHLLSSLRYSAIGVPNIG